MQFNRDELDALMPICGTCINCKVIVWDNDADVKLNKAAFKMPVTGSQVKRPTILVRCGWLKTAVEMPMKIVVCEGYRSSNEQPVS